MKALYDVVRRTGLQRRHVAAVRMCCERTALAVVGQRRARSHGRILAYHAVGTPEWGVNDLSPARFRQHLETALRLGYRFVAAEDIAHGGDPRDLAITFDDGVASVARNAAPILAEYRIPWTFFVVSRWADGDHSFGDGIIAGWRELERLPALGATIASHSASHPNFGRLTAEQVGVELEESRTTIEARLGITVSSFAIPFGRARDWSTAAQCHAPAAGYELVYAYCEDKRHQGTVGRTAVTAFDSPRIFRAALTGAFDGWQEWF